MAVSATEAWILLVSQKEIHQVFVDGLELATPLLGQIKNISLSGVADKAALLSARQKFTNLEMGFQDSASTLIIAEQNFKKYFPGADTSSV